VRVTKRLIDIDDALLAEAKERLGAATIKETVNRALREYIDLELRRGHLVQLTEIGQRVLEDPDHLKRAWRNPGRRT
jgi:Arc/MetJ family transcription regulator